MNVTSSLNSATRLLFRVFCTLKGSLHLVPSSLVIWNVKLIRRYLHFKRSLERTILNSEDAPCMVQFRSTQMEFVWLQKDF